MDNVINKMTGRVFSGCLLALSASFAHCGTMGVEPLVSGKSYVGVFGGGGALTNTNISQYGTAYFLEAVGGPLAVNGFGKANSSSMGMVGAHVGFAWPNNMSIYLPGTLAAELEGYYIGGARLTGHDLSSDTTRLAEHDFLVNYPLNTGVFLVNAVFNANSSLFGMFRPYVGAGLGAAVVSISGASAIQVSPAEPGINHYNANPNDASVAFAAQPKIGVRVDLNPHASVFAEYRFLYLSQTSYTFGSTVALGHAATSPWSVNVGSQYYNMGTVGMDFDL